MYNFYQTISLDTEALLTQTSSDISDLTLDYVGLNVRVTSEWRIAEGVKSEVVKVILDMYYVCVGTE